MILNTYAVVLAFLAVLRLGLGVGVIGVAVIGGEREDRSHLGLLAGVVLVALNLASWPVLIALLHSYISEWPGILCIWGVTQIGRDSAGAAGFLPGLLSLLHLLKPVLVFVGGAWLVLYRINGRTRTGPLLGRVLLGLVPLGGLAIVDAFVELAYVAIPKKEAIPATGCCTVLASGREESGPLPSWLDREEWRPWLSAAYYGGCIGLSIIAATLATRRLPGSIGMMGLAVGALGLLVVAGAFFHAVAAPILLGLPYHRCAYDLVSDVPEAIAAATMLVAGCFSCGWAAVARLLGNHPEARATQSGDVRWMLALGAMGLFASCVMLTLELFLA